jgi:hypothetical protein
LCLAKNRERGKPAQQWQQKNFRDLGKSVHPGFLCWTVFIK